MTQTKQKHTAGPWEARPANLNIKDPLFYRADVIGGGIRVAHVVGVGEDCANANARLIAAAPEMLEALKEAVKLISSEYCFHNRVCSAENSKCYAQKQLQAIAKAEGNS